MCMFCINCGACGKPIDPALQEFRDSMSVCKECGAKLEPGEVVCEKCGWTRPMANKSSN